MMKMIQYALMLGFLLLQIISGAQPSGKISYTFTKKLDKSQVVVQSIQVDGNGGVVERNSGDDNLEIPDVINGEETLTFSGSQGRIDRESPMMMIKTVRNTGGMADVESEEHPQPFIESVHIDWKAKSYKNVVRSGDPKETASFYLEDKFKALPNWELSKKTKKIQGFTCHKASTKYKNESFSIWYTDELPIHYSPMDELYPPSGVVLAIESDIESWEAKVIDLKNPVNTEVISVPKGSILLANKEAYNTIRRKFMDQSMEQFNRQIRN